jgi:dTDP-N-acetylfucosamine:lipid II N-acetylfucosaminyltransferase
MILHCMQAEKFIEPFIDFVEQNFDSSKHQYIIRQSEKFNIKPRFNVLFVEESLSKLKQFLLYAKYLSRTDKIILHGLFDMRLLLILFVQPWLLKKCYWVMWGGDLYYYQNRLRGFRSDLFEVIRASVIRRMRHFITYIKGDYELAHKWYGAKGEYHNCLMYPSNLYRKYVVPPKQGNTVNILVGNSADPTNNHVEVFEKLKPFKDKNIQIVCPLSYGPSEYADQMAQLGNELFGVKFTPLIDFMSFEKYLELLGQIDIGVFAHKRQQSMGNIITLLGLGKKVFMRSDITSWSFFQELEITTYDFQAFNLSIIDENIRTKNEFLIKDNFSLIALVNQWRDIFEG